MNAKHSAGRKWVPTARSWGQLTLGEKQEHSPLRHRITGHCAPSPNPNSRHWPVPTPHLGSSWKGLYTETFWHSSSSFARSFAPPPPFSQRGSVISCSPNPNPTHWPGVWKADGIVTSCRHGISIWAARNRTEVPSELITKVPLQGLQSTGKHACLFTINRRTSICKPL